MTEINIENIISLCEINTEIPCICKKMLKVNIITHRGASIDRCDCGHIISEESLSNFIRPKMEILCEKAVDEMEKKLLSKGIQLVLKN